MQIQRERFLGAGHYERTPERHGYANGYKPKRIDTPAGTVNVQVPNTAGQDGEPFYPQSLERGRRSVRHLCSVASEILPPATAAEWPWCSAATSASAQPPCVPVSIPNHRPIPPT
ncbi:MAG: hypothetical protein FKY71_13620 [Spiribacter salinus]|uniref:Transposase n=1 Tax=Spiribacter salinus TaxID=1335746 RepID=A0A540VP37_9GAMM|nr:MAG: hypothetical protein FKY71_13620 [Spiribacter salinus]